MRRTTPLTITAMLGLALLAPTASAGAAGETCRGEAATLVGTQQKLVGTEGRDVIVTGNATDVDARGGDDLICVVPGKVNINVLDVEAGSGNDVVDTTGASSTYYVDTDLGPGADTFEGGASGDWVKTGDASGSTAEVDVVRTGAGGDSVTTSGGSDVVELGPGTNRLVLDGTGITAQGRLVGGEEHDTFSMKVAGTAEHAFDLAAGTYRTAGASADFSSFEALAVRTLGANVSIAGTEGDDYVDVVTEDAPSTVVADLRGGDDSLNIDGTLLGAGTRIDLGEGQDRLIAARPKGALALDMVKDELEVVDDTYPAAGVEESFMIARRVTLVGDEQDNDLIAYACKATLTGGAGDDQLIWDYDYFFDAYTLRCTTTTTMRGGAGDDSFYGSPGDDRLFGDGGNDIIRADAGDDRVRGGKGADQLQGSRGHDDIRGGGGADKLYGHEGRDVLVGEGGRDLAVGSAGSDRCVAEREKTCER